MKRPDLTYLTLIKFRIENFDRMNYVRNDDDVLISYSHINDDSNKYLKAISIIPEMVQLIEMMHDMTLNNPSSLVHLATQKVLEDLRIDEKTTPTVIEISKDAEKFKHKQNDENFDKPISNLHKEY